MLRLNVNKPKALYLGADAKSEDLAYISNILSAAPYIAIDTETTGLTVWKDVPLYWSIAWPETKGVPAGRAALHARTLEYFSPIFKNPNIKWLLANAKFDMHMLANVGYRLSGTVWDIQVMHGLLYEEELHNLKHICKQILGWTWGDFEDQFGKIDTQIGNDRAFRLAAALGVDVATINPKDKMTAEQVIRIAEHEDMSLLIEYAANDAWGTLCAGEELKKLLEGSSTVSAFNNHEPYINTLWDYFYKVEAPFTKVLWKMEHHGVRIDVERVERTIPAAEKDIRSLERRITQLAGFPLNPKSNNDLRKVFFEQKNYKARKFTNTGLPSCDQHFLKTIAAEDPLAKALLDLKELNTLKDTFLTGMLKNVDTNGKIHTSYDQSGTRTGRISSKRPNLQNIPAEDRWDIRKMYIPDEGCLFVVADYGQLEQRILAEAANDADMIQSFKQGRDIHITNASLIFNVDYDTIERSKILVDSAKEEQDPKKAEKLKAALTDDVKHYAKMRKIAKTVGFGLNYGMGPGKMAADLGISRKEAEQIIERYKNALPAVGRFFDSAVALGRQYGYAWTFMGRRRAIFQIASTDGGYRSKGERQAVNTVIQGSAADIVKYAQIRLEQENIDSIFGANMLLQVHDEIVTQVPKDEASKFKRFKELIMLTPTPKELNCPMAVDAKIGPSWGHCK